MQLIKIKIACISIFTVLFLWISFFAPLVGENWRTLFISVLAVFLLISLCIDKNSYKLIFSNAEIPFWIFLLTMAGGLISVKEPPIAYWHFWSFIFPVPFLYFFAKIAFRERWGVFIVKALCVMALLVCALGIAEFITKQNFIYEYFRNNMYYGVFIGRRMISTQIHSTPLSTYLLAVFPLTLALHFKAKKSFIRILMVACSAIIFVSIVLTFSRGALIGAFMEILIMLIFLSTRKKFKFILFLVLVFAAIIALGSLLMHFGCNNFFRHSLRGLSHGYIYWGKLDRLLAVGEALKDYPFFGLGFGHFRILFDYYLPHLADFCSSDSKVADCMYLTILAETGLVGFSGFVLFISFLFKRIWQKLKSESKNEDKLFLVCFFSGLIGMMCGFLTYDGLYWIAPSYLFWSYAGISSFLANQNY